MRAFYFLILVSLNIFVSPGWASPQVDQASAYFCQQPPYNRTSCFIDSCVGTNPVGWPVGECQEHSGMIHFPSGASELFNSFAVVEDSNNKGMWTLTFSSLARCNDTIQGDIPAIPTWACAPISIVLDHEYVSWVVRTNGPRPTPTPTPTPADSHGGLSDHTIIGIVLGTLGGVCVLCMLVSGISVFIWWRRRSTRHADGYWLIQS